MPHKKKCSPCELSAALGLALGVCETALKKEVDCKSLESKLVKGKIHKETVFRTLYAAAEKSGRKDVMRDVKEVAGLIHVKV